MSNESDTPTRYCTHCGRPDRPFRSPHALRCTVCDGEVAEDRKVYHQNYHLARSRSLKHLIDNHRAEFDNLMRQERTKIEQEQDAEREQQTAVSTGVKPKRSRAARAAS